MEFVPQNVVTALILFHFGITILPALIAPFWYLAERRRRRREPLAPVLELRPPREEERRRAA